MKISKKWLSLNSPQPPSMNQNKKKLWKCNQHLIKMNFGAKQFFWKNSKTNIPPPPWFSPKNTSRVVIPTDNGQTVQFQVLKHLFLSSAPWKTTKMTYISIIRQIWKNSPEKGCFLALNVPRGREPEFCQSLRQWFYIWYNCLRILTKFQEKATDR